MTRKKLPKKAPEGSANHFALFGFVSRVKRATVHEHSSHESDLQPFLDITSVHPPMVKTAEALLQQELGAARAGTHQRQKSEEKRLSLLKIQKLKKAEQTHQNRVAAVDARFEEQKREVCTHRPIAKTSAPSEQMRHGCEPQAVGCTVVLRLCC